jgi:hypothetical protein
LFFFSSKKYRKWGEKIVPEKERKVTEKFVFVTKKEERRSWTKQSTRDGFYKNLPCLFACLAFLFQESQPNTDYQVNPRSPQYCATERENREEWLDSIFGGTIVAPNFRRRRVATGAFCGLIRCDFWGRFFACLPRSRIMLQGKPVDAGKKFWPGLDHNCRSRLASINDFKMSPL